MNEVDMTWRKSSRKQTNIKIVKIPFNYVFINIYNTI